MFYKFKMFYKLKEWCLLKASSIVRLLRGEVSTASLIKQGLTVGSNFSRQGGGKNRRFISFSD